jgi:hypothetical protein
MRLGVIILFEFRFTRNDNPSYEAAPFKMKKFHQSSGREMDIETSAYVSPGLKRPQGQDSVSKDYEKGFINGVKALRNHRVNEIPSYAWRGGWSEIVSDQLPLRALSVPNTLPILRTYLADIAPAQRRVVWGFWENEIVYVNLNVPVEIQDGPPLEGSVTIEKIEELVLGTDVSFDHPSADGHCVGCIEGTGTALIMLDQHSPLKWYLWTPDGAVRQGWKGVHGYKESFVMVDSDDLKIKFEQEYSGRVEQVTDEPTQ